MHLIQYWIKSFQSHWHLYYCLNDGLKMFSLSVDILVDSVKEIKVYKFLV